MGKLRSDYETWKGGIGRMTGCGRRRSKKVYAGRSRGWGRRRNPGGKLGLKGVIDAVNVDVLFGSGSGISSSSEDLAADLQGKVVGHAKGRNLLRGRIG